MFRNYSASSGGRPLPVTPPSSEGSATTVDTPACAEHTLDVVVDERHALDVFLDDYSYVSRNATSTRGYLHGLEALLTQAGPSSDTTKAAKVAALVSLGNKLNQPALLRHAAVLYSDLLRSFQATMMSDTTTNTLELSTIAMILGLYEVNDEAFTFDIRGIEN